jgi:hypothetical protein
LFKKAFSGGQKKMSKINLPTTDPLWVDQRIMDNVDMTSAEGKIAKEQTEAMSKTLDILNQPVKKGDYKAANKKAEDLQKHFESLSPDTKKYLYNQLQSKTGGGVIDGTLAGQFRYYLERGQRDKLLKTLNPDHQRDEIKKYTMKDAKEKASKTFELDVKEKQIMKNLEDLMNKNKGTTGNGSGGARID